MILPRPLMIRRELIPAARRPGRPQRRIRFPRRAACRRIRAEQVDVVRPWVARGLHGDERALGPEEGEGVVVCREAEVTEQQLCACQLVA